MFSLSARVAAIAVAACVLILIGPGIGGEASPLRQAAPSLGTAGSFAVLGGSTVTNTGATTVNGDLGVSPGTAVTGFPPGTVVGGSIHAADALAGQAQSDVTTAYNNLAGQPCTATLTGQDLGGMSLTPGVYCFATSAQLTGALTLNAQGNAGAVFVFKIGSTLTTAPGSSVLMINGGSPCNLFWQIGTSATIGTTTAFQGNILALASITLNNGASVSGRALARNGAVTMDTNTITAAACGVPPAATATPTAAAPATATTVAAATATAVTAATATAVTAATATAVTAATATAITGATATAIATLPPATQTAVVATATAAPAATQTAIAGAAATVIAGGLPSGPGCVANIRGSKVDGAGAGVPDWTVQLLQGDQVIKTTTTDKNGNWDFLGLGPGAYTVREVTRDGWVLRGPDRYDVVLTACGQNAAGFNFVNVRSADAGQAPPAAPAAGTLGTPGPGMLATPGPGTPAAGAPGTPGVGTPAAAAANTPAAATPGGVPSALPRTGGGLPGAALFALLGSLLAAAGLLTRRGR
jgi:hypothetical protein